ncbi:MAG: hypothetical protein SFU98_16630 [Leptospiraceae bacterium]|nr:hypothetical protein [Leptospiraceae bacterium]
MRKAFIVQPETPLQSFMKGETIQIYYKVFHFEGLDEIYKLGSNCLDLIGLTKYYQTLQIAMKELVQNAVKATLKRHYFQIQKLNIDTDYQKGMDEFRDFLEKSKDIPFPLNLEYSAKIEIVKTNEIFTLRVITPYAMLPREEQIVNQMIERGKTLGSVSELFDDDTRLREGGGLGLSMILILGKTFYPPEKLLTYKIEAGKTEFCLNFPI